MVWTSEGPVALQKVEQLNLRVSRYTLKLRIGDQRVEEVNLRQGAMLCSLFVFCTNSHKQILRRCRDKLLAEVWESEALPRMKVWARFAPPFFLHASLGRISFIALACP